VIITHGNTDSIECPGLGNNDHNGVYGQVIYVDPQLKLVIVQTAANVTRRAGQTSLAREANALRRGLLQFMEHVNGDQCHRKFEVKRR
jgi:CubicO group peptidase (beta-lactamase class C family)